MPTALEHTCNLLFTPVRDLALPGLAPDQLAGLRALPESNRLKLIYALRALEPLAEHGPTELPAVFSLVTEILSALGAFLARNSKATLTDLRSAAALTLIDLRCRHQPPTADDSKILLSPQVVLLEAAEMAQLRRARSAGKSAEILAGAARMILELWEFADRLRRAPAQRAGELIHIRCWGSPATTKILRVLGLEGFGTSCLTGAPSAGAQNSQCPDRGITS